MANVSVIIPAYNAGSALHRVVESVLNQTVAPKEVIVIDDGSDDDTARVAQSFGKRIIFIKQENSGQGAARNRGLEVARGKYIAFLDADDYWKPEFIEKMTRFLDAKPDAIAASCGYFAKKKSGDYTGPNNIDALHERHPHGLVLEDFFSFWAEHDHIRTGTALIRKSIIDQVGHQNGNLRMSQDLEYWGLLGTWGAWGLLPEVLWVGDPGSVVKKQGWRRKYAKRRRMCPSVEAWQARILPRLEEGQLAAFKIVRGRVALGYAHAKLLAGDDSEAVQIIRRYGSEMPNGSLVQVMKTGVQFGRAGWEIAVLIIKGREYIKG